MRIISRARLREYWAGHPDDETSLKRWHKVVKSASWKRFADIKKTFNTVRAYPDNRVVMRPSEKFEAKAAGQKGSEAWFPPR